MVDATARDGDDATTTDKPRRGLTINWELNLTTLITLGTLLGSGMFMLVQARNDIDTMKTTVTEVKGDIGSMRDSLKVLPQQTFQIDDLKRRFDELSQWRAIVENRLGENRDLTRDLNSRVSSIERASSQDVQRPGVRR